MDCRETGKKLIIRNIKDGLNTNLWFDPWILGNSLINKLGWTSFIIPGKVKAIVSDIIINNQWFPNLNLATSSFEEKIKYIPIDINAEIDNWEWASSRNENFSFKNTWDYIRGHGSIVDWHQSIWDKTNCPKMAICSYFALLNKLPTKIKL